MPFSCVIIGDESLAVESARQVLAQGGQVLAFVTDNLRIRDWAQGRGISCLQPGQGLHIRLGGLSPDWIFNIAGLRLLPPAVLALAQKGCINFHDGPLPQHAGLNAPAWAILQGDGTHAVTWHLMTEQVDKGDILLQHSFAISPEDTAFTLNARCFTAGVESFAALLELLIAGHLAPKPQPATGGQTHRLSDRPANNGLLDPARPAADLERLVRALTHGPHWNPLTTPKLQLGDRIVIIGHAEICADQGNPGAVLALDADSITLACGEAALRLSGLLCQEGQPLDPAVLTHVGYQIAQPPAGLSAALAPLHGGEQIWRDRLRSMAPARLPSSSGANSGANSGGSSGQRESLPVTLPKAPAEAIARFARAVGALLGQVRFDLALCTGEMAQVQQAARGHASGWVPLRADLASADLAGDIVRTLDIARRFPGFPEDISARDPQLGRIMRPDIAVTDGAETSNAALVLDLRQSMLHHDPSVLQTTQITSLLARMQNEDAMPAMAAADDIARKPYPRTCLHHAFEAQVTRTPDATAIVHDGQSLSYAELNARANKVAHVLLGMGVQPDMPVGLSTTRGISMLVGALGILKAGGAYVPLDPAYPQARLAHYLQDSAARIIVTEHALRTGLPAAQALLLALDTDPRLADAPDSNPETAVTPDHLAYLIYTSGSTGVPKGVMIEHANLANFMAAMDDHIRHDPPGVWLALTSLNFDISVLELFWTLARGFKVVLGSPEQVAPAHPNPAHPNPAPPTPAPLRVSGTGMNMSLMYWGNDDGPGPQKYQLLLEGAKFADTHGFTAIWTPERHFHAFGGPFPNSAVTGAAVAAVTRNLAVRAGSCVAPLHHPIRIAEDWAVIDNLTNGRAGLGLASGWHPVDFVLNPQNRPPQNRRALFDMIDTLRRLWRGEEVAFDKGDGVQVPIQTLPRPVSRELPIWLTTAGNPETWRDAGRLGAHVLTHLLGQSISEVAEKIAIYHEALRGAGHDPAEFQVCLMLHTYVAGDRAHARSVAEGPMKSYLQAAAGLVKQYAWAFPAFKRPQGAQTPMEIDLSTLSRDEVDGVLDYAFDRYFEDSGLFGTVEDCLARVEELKAIGVTEIACLIDYGIPAEQVLEGLYPLAEVLRRTNAGQTPDQQDQSIAALIQQHKVTHLQATPSLARMLMQDDPTRAALATVPDILLGGEALPGKLARDLALLTGTAVCNMYGPTETTIWSSCHRSRGAEHTVELGRPIANTSFHVVDADLRPVPMGTEGELLIGGDSVARGYWNRPELTAERFVTLPFAQGRLYRTGDLVRQRNDGVLEFLGRMDQQVKLRGHRIELGEIEAALEAQPGITAAVVTLREDRPGDQRLVAYYTGNPAGDLRTALSQALPAHMQPAHLVPLAAFPLTPNRKIDRAALPAPSALPAIADTAPPEPRIVDKTGSPAALDMRIAAIWARVLGVEHVRQTDNFFHLGGHSLLAVQAHREMRAELGLPGMSITDLFRFPVLQDLARHLSRMAAPLPATSLPLQQATEPAAPTATTAATPRSELLNRRRAMRMKQGHPA